MLLLSILSPLYLLAVSLFLLQTKIVIIFHIIIHYLYSIFISMFILYDTNSVS